MTDLNPTTKFSYITLLCCQLRKILSIYIPTISIYENDQPVQVWNPTTTIKIKKLKMRYIDLQKQNEYNNK